MLQRLLAGRFGLKSHYEDRPMGVLVVKAGAIKSFVDGGEPTFALKGTVLEIRSATMREVCDDAHSGEGEQRSGGKPNRIPGRSRTAVGA